MIRQISLLIILFCAISFFVSGEEQSTITDRSPVGNESNVTNNTFHENISTHIQNRTQEPSNQSNGTENSTHAHILDADVFPLNFSIAARLDHEKVLYSFSYDTSSLKTNSCTITYSVSDERNKTIRPSYTTTKLSEKQVSLSTLEPVACLKENASFSYMWISIRATLHCQADNLTNRSNQSENASLPLLILINGTTKNMVNSSMPLPCVPTNNSSLEQNKTLNSSVQNSTEQAESSLNDSLLDTDDDLVLNGSTTFDSENTTDTSDVSDHNDVEKMLPKRPTSLQVNTIDVQETHLEIELELYKNETRKYTFYIELKNGSYSVGEPIKEKVIETNTTYKLDYTLSYSKNRMFCSRLKDRYGDSVTLSLHFTGLGLDTISDVNVPRNYLDAICGIERQPEQSDGQPLQNSEPVVPKRDSKRSPPEQTAHRSATTSSTTSPKEHSTEQVGQDTNSSHSSEGEAETVYLSSEERFKRYSGYLVGISFIALVITLFLT